MYVKKNNKKNFNTCFEQVTYGVILLNNGKQKEVKECKKCYNMCIFLTISVNQNSLIY